MNRKHKSNPLFVAEVLIKRILCSLQDSLLRNFLYKRSLLLSTSIKSM